MTFFFAFYWLAFFSIPPTVLFQICFSYLSFIISTVTNHYPGISVIVSPGYHLTSVKGSHESKGGGKFWSEGCLWGSHFVDAHLKGLGVSGMNFDTDRYPSCFRFRSTIDSLFARILWSVTDIYLCYFSLTPSSKFLKGFSSSFMIP